MALPVGSYAETIPSFPPCHCLVDGVWHSSIRAQGTPGRNFCSGSVSYFRDLYLPEQFQAASCPYVRFLIASFPRFVCGQWRKSTYKHHGQSLIGWKCGCVCVCVCWWWWKWTVFPLFGWVVCLEMGRKTYCASQWHSRPGTRCRNIHFYILFLWRDTETMKLIVLSEETRSLFL